ncbi:BACON domain-containing protein [Bacteroides reticulotermitis]|uniref:BACON domain-containing protein n=1 Tax=Bacteroides reticulotermitis TaxID=1133319 RepID=UPI003A8BED1D
MQKLFYAPLFLLMAYICWGCSADRDDFNSSGTGKDTRLTFSVSLPTKANTYSLKPTNENNVSSIYVLAFKYQTNRYELADWSQAPESDIWDNGDSNKKKFTITFTRLKKGDSYKFVLLANAKDEVDALFQDGVTVGAEKNTTLQKVQLSGITHWNVDPSTDPSSSYRDIPMWGETPSHDGTDDMAVSQDMSITDLKLLRMVARINVFVDGEGATPATSRFKLKSVDLYNTHQNGQVAPDMDHLIAGSMSKVKAPTVVLGSSVTNVPIVYDENMAGCTVSDAALSNTIYTFETEVPRDESDNVVYEDLTCLVIGGEFESDGKTTYYRVNLNKKGEDGKVTYLDVLRNHTYNIKIVKIKGSGYDTSKEAFDAKAINMEAEVVGWDDGEVGEINESGGYRLALSPGSIFEFYRNGDPQIVNIKTDYPGGWKVVEITGNWLKVDKEIDTAQGKDGSKVPMTLTVDANNTGNERVGYIYIQYANTKIYLTVNQSTDDEVSIEVTSNGQVVSELLFTSMDETISQKLDIKWSPSDGDLAIVNSAPGSFPFEGDMPGTTTVSGGTGIISYAITPIAFIPEDKEKPFERISKLDFTTTDGINHASASVFLRHVNYNMSAEEIASSYSPNGSTYTFKIKSNVDWRIKSIEPSSDKLLNIQSGDNLVEGFRGNANLSTGTAVQFTVVNDEFSGVKGTVDVVFESADMPPKFAEKKITLEIMGEYYPKTHGGWAGSNIYWDGTKLTFDDSLGESAPHKKYQGVFFNWASLYGIPPANTYNVGSTAWSSSDGVYGPSGWEYILVWLKWPQVAQVAIPSNPPVGKTERDRAYLYEITDGSKGIGDICKYLTEKAAGGLLYGKKWRMPTSNEFEKAEDYKWIGGYEGTVMDPKEEVDGSRIIERAYIREKTYFPAAGSRQSNAGKLTAMGIEGSYWASSPQNNIYTYYLSFRRNSGEDKINTEYAYTNFSRRNACSVRCVVDIK